MLCEVRQNTSILVLKQRVCERRTHWQHACTHLLVWVQTDIILCRTILPTQVSAAEKTWKLVQRHNLAIFKYLHFGGCVVELMCPADLIRLNSLTTVLHNASQCLSDWISLVSGSFSSPWPIFLHVGVHNLGEPMSGVSPRLKHSAFHTITFYSDSLTKNVTPLDSIDCSNQTNPDCNRLVNWLTHNHTHKDY